MTGTSTSLLAQVERLEPEWRQLYASVREAAVDLGVLPAPIEAARWPDSLDFDNEESNWRRMGAWEEDLQEYEDDGA